MKFACKGLIAAASFLALAGAAQAATQTLTAADSVTPNGWPTLELAGTGTWTFSNMLINSLNSVKARFEEVAPAKVTTPYRPGTTMYLRDGASYVTHSVDTMTADFGDTSFTMKEMQTVGGARQITLKNGATTGAGDLTIANLHVVIGDRAGFGGTIYADLSSTTEGFINRTGYALWTFDQLIGQTIYSMPMAHSSVAVNNSLHGLFLVNKIEGLDLFKQALRLNAVGLSTLYSVENRTIASNRDPITGKVAGWGSIATQITVSPVPEPSTCVLMLAGLTGVGMAARRRAAR